MLIPGLEKLEVPSRTPGKVTILTDPKNNTLPSHKAELQRELRTSDVLGWPFEMAKFTVSHHEMCSWCISDKQTHFQLQGLSTNFQHLAIVCEGLGCFGPELGSLAFQRLKITRCWALPWHLGLVLPWYLGVRRGFCRFCGALHGGSFPGCLAELRGATV